MHLTYQKASGSHRCIPGWSADLKGITAVRDQGYLWISAIPAIKAFIMHLNKKISPQSTS